MPVSPPEVEDLQRAGSSLASRVRGLEAIAREARDRIHLTQEQLQRHSTWITHHKGDEWVGECRLTGDLTSYDPNYEKLGLSVSLIKYYLFPPVYTSLNEDRLEAVASSGRSIEERLQGVTRRLDLLDERMHDLSPPSTRAAKELGRDIAYRCYRDPNI